MANSATKQSGRTNSASGRPAVDIDNIDVFYGAVQILFGSRLAVAEGEVLALLGTNGAGKSTLLKAIAGLVPTTAGTIASFGRCLDDDTAERRISGGIGLVSGGNAIFRSLSVRDNLRVGAYLLGKNKDLKEQRTTAVLELFPNLTPMLGRPAGLLSGGEQQMLAIAKALLLDPKILLIDELSLGLAPIVVGQLIEVVESLRTAGTTMIIVEQSLNVALHLAERAVFMEKGRVRFEGLASELAERDDIARAVFLGGQQ